MLLWKQIRNLDQKSKQKKFFEERGPPYRQCDIFDDTYAQVHSQLNEEHKNSSTVDFNLIHKNLNEIALKLFECEYPQTKFNAYSSHSKGNFRHQHARVSP